MVQSAVISCFILQLYPLVVCLTCYFLSLSVSPSVFSSVNHSLFTEVLVFPSLLVSSSVPSPLLMFDLHLLPVPSCFSGSYFVFCFGSWISSVFALCLLFPLFWEFMDLGFSAFLWLKLTFHSAACLPVCLAFGSHLFYSDIHGTGGIFREWGSFLPDVPAEYAQVGPEALCVLCLTSYLAGSAWCSLTRILSAPVRKKKKTW